MVDIKKTIDIIFNGVDEVSGTLKTIGSNVESFGDGIQDIGEPFANAAEKVAILNAAIAGLAIAGLKVSSDMESSGVRMQAALGLTTEEASRFKETAIAAYNTGLIDDMAAAFDAVTIAQQKFGDDAGVSIENVVLRAAELQHIFGVDFKESMAAVKTLMQNFGIDSETAFGFITRGYQEGLNGSDDFLQSINEYSTQFASGGASATQFFSVMESGYQEGMLGTDRAADAFKEFRDRITDGSEATQQALASIGLDNNTLSQNINTGKITVTQAFDLVIAKLNNATDTTTVMQAGMGLLGTQFHDLGTQAALGISTATTSLDDFKTSLDSLGQVDFSTQMESAWRTTITSFGDIDLWNDAKQKIAEVFTSIAENIPQAFEAVDFSGLVEAADDVWNQIGAIFSGSGSDFDLTTLEGLENAIQTTIDSIESVIRVTSGMVEAFEPVVTAVSGLIGWFNDLDDATKLFIGNVIAAGASLTVLGGIVSTGGSLIVGLGTLLGIISGPAGLAVGFASLVGYLVTDAVGAFEAVGNAEKSLQASTENLASDMQALKSDLEALPAEVSTEIIAEIDIGNYDKAIEMAAAIPDEIWMSVKSDVDIAPVENYVKLFGEIPPEISTQITAAINAGDFDEVQRIINDLMLEPVVIKPTIDPAAISEVKQGLQELEFYSETEGWQTIKVPIEPEADKEKAKQAATELAEKLDPLKVLDIETKLDIKQVDENIARIEAGATIAQKAMELTASIDIAAIEAATKQIESAFGSVNVGIESTGELIGDALGTLAGEGGFEAKWAASDILKSEQLLREQEFELQKKLVDEQTKYLELKNKALEEDGAMTIQIDSTGLEPALEMVMWEIIQKVQIRASEESAEFLLGMT